MDEKKKGYWAYSIVAVIVGMMLFAFWGYLIYDLILRLSGKDFSNNTVVQALFSLVSTVFLGGYFSKWLEYNNNRKIEMFKLKRDIALKIVDCATELVYHPGDAGARELLVAESSKVKLYLDDKTLKAINDFIEADNKRKHYDPLIAQLKMSIR